MDSNGLATDDLPNSFIITNIIVPVRYFSRIGPRLEISLINIFEILNFFGTLRNARVKFAREQIHQIERLDDFWQILR